MKIVDVYKVENLEPVLLHEFVENLKDDLDEIFYLKSNFTDKEAAIKKYEEDLQARWESARKSKNYDSMFPKLFISIYNEYKKVLQTDPQEALLKAEYLEKKLNYTYEGFLDKKFWNYNALLYLSDYLASGKAKTLKQATELLKKEEPGFIHE